MKTTRTTACPSCEVASGEFHRPGCVVEPCPYCGRPLFQCAHAPKGKLAPPPLDDRIRWMDKLPGEEECEKLGWVHASAFDGSKTVPDLARLFREAEWDRDRKRWVPLEGDRERHDFFDLDAYKRHPPRPGKCWGCGKRVRRDRPVGRSNFLLRQPVRKDLLSLGIDATEAPEVLELCSDCDLRYACQLERRLYRLSMSTKRQDATQEEGPKAVPPCP